MKASTLIFDYVCAVCWGQLIEDIDQHSAVCARYGVEHAGYHRRSGVDWQRGHSDHDRQEVIALYQDITPINYLLGLAKRPTSITQQQLAANRRALGRDDTGL